jgi:hypothetical protein
MDLQRTLQNTNRLTASDLPLPAGDAAGAPSSGCEQ